MSLLPIILDSNWGLTGPSRILDQRFGMGPDVEELLSLLNGALVRNRPYYYRPWSSEAAKYDSGSTKIANKDKFQVNLDVQQFAPEEITVKVSGKNTITVEGKHEEKQDEHGVVSRHFVRRYVLPEGHDINNVVSNLSSDGVLSITAPTIDQPQGEQRTIPIQHAGEPSKPITDTKQEESKN